MLVKEVGEIDSKGPILYQYEFSIFAMAALSSARPKFDEN
jgi:hypothetical protein